MVMVFEKRSTAETVKHHHNLFHVVAAIEQPDFHRYLNWDCSKDFLVPVEMNRQRIIRHSVIKINEFN